MSDFNPKCTDFCTANGKCKGHLPTRPEDIDHLSGLLLNSFIPLKASREAIDFLYQLGGYGYHVAADVLGISHERAYMIITDQDPGD